MLSLFNQQSPADVSQMVEAAPKTAASNPE